MSEPNRQPKGQSVGGQFAPTRNPESNVEVGASVAVIDEIDGRGEGGRGPSSLYDFGNEFVVAHSQRGGWEPDPAVTSPIKAQTSTA